jgi:hypothetical protein
MEKEKGQLAGGFWEFDPILEAWLTIMRKFLDNGLTASSVRT